MTNHDILLLIMYIIIVVLGHRYKFYKERYFETEKENADMAVRLGREKKPVLHSKRRERYLKQRAKVKEKGIVLARNGMEVMDNIFGKELAREK